MRVIAEKNVTVSNLNLLKNMLINKQMTDK